MRVNLCDVCLGRDGKKTITTLRTKVRQRTSDGTKTWELYVCPTHKAEIQRSIGNDGKLFIAFAEEIGEKAFQKAKEEADK